MERKELYSEHMLKRLGRFLRSADIDEIRSAVCINDWHQADVIVDTMLRDLTRINLFPEEILEDFAKTGGKKTLAAARKAAKVTRLYNLYFPPLRAEVLGTYSKAA